MHGVCPGRDRIFRAIPPCLREIKVREGTALVWFRDKVCWQCLVYVRREEVSRSASLLGMQMRRGAGGEGRGGSETGWVCLREDEVCNRHNIVGYTCDIVCSMALCTGKCEERCVICIFMRKSTYIRKTVPTGSLGIGLFSDLKIYKR